MTFDPTSLDTAPLTAEVVAIPNADLDAFVDFMCGAGEFDGAWFGDAHHSLSGHFWWRTRLRKTIATLRASEAALSTQLADEQRIATERGNHIEFELMPQMAGLTMQIAERDAELARVTADLCETEALEMQHGAVIERMSARIAALTEALTELRDEMKGRNLTGSRAYAASGRALTTDKEPTT